MRGSRVAVPLLAFCMGASDSFDLPGRRDLLLRRGSNIVGYWDTLIDRFFFSLETFSQNGGGGSNG